VNGVFISLFVNLPVTIPLNISIDRTSFFANYGFHPNSVIDALPTLLKDNASVLTRDCAARFDAFHQHLTKAKEDFKKYGDKSKSIGPNFKVNDLVYLKRYYFSNEPSKRWASQCLGPFKIIEKRERINYRLELPENLELKVNQNKKMIKNKFIIKEISKVNFIIGIKFVKYKGGYFLNQKDTQKI